MQTIQTIARADWGPVLRAVAGRLAYVVAVLIVAAELTYRAGLATGRALHSLNDYLAGLASGRIDRAQTARAVMNWANAILAPSPEPAPVVTMPCAAEPAPSAGIVPPPLESLTVAELRAMARARGLSGLARRGRRADLIVALT